MSSQADSLTVFAEGTFKDQVVELVNFLAKGLSEEEKAEYVQPFQNLLRESEDQTPLADDTDRKRQFIKLVLGAVKGLGDGTDREIEGFFNLLYAHILTLFPEPSALKEQLAPLLHTISVAEDHVNVKYRILSNLFNALPRASALRILVYQALLDLAQSQDDLGVLQINISDVERWLKEWDISSEEKSSFLKSISGAFAQAEQTEASYEYFLAYVRSLPPSSGSAQPAVLEAIAMALRIPSVIEFDSLTKLENLKTAKDHPLFSLLKIFVGGVLSDYQAWAKTNQGILKDFDLPSATLERKIRLLTLSSLATQYIGSDLTYAEISSTLQIDAKDVETWAIDVIRLGLLSGKLSQPTQTLHVTRASHRSFKPEDWKELEKRLTTWRAELVGVLEVLAGAKARNSVVASTKTKGSSSESQNISSDKSVANTV